MPELIFPLTELDTHVIDPIVSQLIWSVLKDIRIDNLFDSSNVYLTSDRRQPSGTNDGFGNINITHTRCDVALEEINNPQAVKWNNLKLSNTNAYGITRFRNNIHIPFFSDPNINVRVLESYSTVTLKLDFSLKFTNNEEAKLAETILRNKYLGESTVNEHDFRYEYPFVQPLYNTLITFYVMQPDVMSRMTFMEYLKSHSSDDIYAIKSVSDKLDSELVVEKNTIRVIGQLYYDADKVNPIQVEKITDRWDISFTYFIQFSKPDTIFVYFPVVIENELVPDELISKNQNPYICPALEGVFREKSLNVYARNAAYPNNIKNAIRLPYYDDWIVPDSHIQAKAFRPFIISCFLIETEHYTYIDLRDLGDVRLHPIVIELMEQHGKDIFGFNGIFNVSIFSNNNVLGQSRVSLVDESLLISIDATNKSRRYHLVISEAMSFTYMDKKYIELIMKYRYFFGLLITKHARKLINMHYYRYVPNSQALTLIERCMRADKLDRHISTMITAGHATTELYQYATVPVQFLDYILEHYSPITRKLLYDEFLDLGLRVGCIRDIDIPDLKLEDDTKIINHQGGVHHGVSTPFRVLNSTIIPKRR